MDTTKSVNNIFGNKNDSKNNPQHTVVDINLDDVEGGSKKNDKSFWDELNEFGCNTTHHGVNYVADSNNHILRR